MAGQLLTIGPFRLDRSGVLWRDGLPVSLGRRGLLLLETLLRHRGEVVGKAELIDAAWPGEAVEESNLSVQIAKLRKCLGGDWIRTVERVGYQLADEPRQDHGLVTPTLAIRPFRNLCGAADVAEAITDDLTTALARFGSFRVVTSPSGFAVADYVLEGSARYEGKQLQIAARLAEQHSGHYRWAERFAARATHHFAVDRIASIVEGQIELAEIAMAQSERSASENAPDLYRRAQLHMRTTLPDDYAAATALLERALARDPDNIRYLAAMCETLGHGISMGWPALTGADAERLVDCASRGLRQPAADAETLSWLGFGMFRTADPDWGYGLIQRSAELNPHSLTALSLAGQAAMHWGSLVDAEAYLRRGTVLDPQHPAQGMVLNGLARIRMIEGQFDQALVWANRAYLANRTFGGTRWTLIAANAQLGRAEVSAGFLDRFRADHPGVTIATIRAGQPTRARLSSTLEGLDRAGLVRGS